MFRRAKSVPDVKPTDKLLPRLTLYFFKRPRKVAFVWLVVLAFGLFSYTSLLKREGFPSVQIPIAVVTGTYFVNDSAKVDQELAKPITELALKQNDVSSVRSESAGNFFSVTVQYKESVNAKAAAKSLEKIVKQHPGIPKSANLNFAVPFFNVTGEDLQKIDIALSLYDPTNASSTEQLTSKAQAAAKALNEKKLSLVETAFVKNPYETVTDPVTGQGTKIQRTFDRYGLRSNNSTQFHSSVLVGVTSLNNADVIKLDQQVRQAVNDLEKQADFKGYQIDVSASYAPSITETINELQRTLLEGLLAVLVIGSLIIAVRASLITVMSMVTVLSVTVGLLYLIGYSLNVITLFALVLGLSLIVDDTIIMVEAIDAARRKHKNSEQAVSAATSKVSRAMVAATSTAALSFVPLLFVGGILGEFIRAIPVTIISALLISLFVALLFIPLFSRYLLLGKKQMGEHGVKEVAAGIEGKIVHGISRPMIWARNSTKRLFAVGMVAVVIGFGFIAAGSFIASKVVFNIFPPTKDTNGLMMTLNFPPNTTIDQAQSIAAEADAFAASRIGENFVQASYYDTGRAQSAMVMTEITSYNKRDVTSKQLVDQLQKSFDNEFTQARVTIGQTDVGPPEDAFVVLVQTEDRTAGFSLAGDIANYLKEVQLERPSGKIARLKNVNVSSPDQYSRTGDKQVIRISADFDGTDTTTLVTLAQNAVKKEYDTAKLKQYQLAANAVQFDLGQESENQESFKTLALAFPIVLIVIYILLAIQFRSLLQPLMIFMAIPFSIFGVMLGLYVTDNAISFFAVLGFFALIGLSIKNTILLTDFANQSRKAGLGTVDSAVAALAERFRPLVATSLTAVVSLIPLALTSPFWEGLAVVLIFGLLSSTLLVILVFPYYYLGGEFLRHHISRTSFFTWLLSVGLITYLAMRIAGSQGIFLGILAAILLPLLKRMFAQRTAK